MKSPQIPLDKKNDVNFTIEAMAKTKNEKNHQDKTK
jgi:hypothetical protein